MKKGRKQLARLPESLGKEFRERVNARLRSKHLSRDRVAEVEVEYYGSRSRRWIDGALSFAAPLPVDTAIEIAVRLGRLDVRLSDRLLTKLMSSQVWPMLIMFPNEGAPLAKLLAEQADQVAGVSRRALPQLESTFARTFREYERFNETPLGRDILKEIKLACSDSDDERLRMFMHRSRSPIAIKGKLMAVYSIPRLVEDEFRRRVATRDSRTTGAKGGSK